LLGYNPVQTILGPQVLGQLPPANAAYLTGRGFFPSLISGPFSDGLGVAFAFAITACVVAGIASLLRGGKYVYVEPDAEATPAELPDAIGTGSTQELADELADEDTFATDNPQTADAGISASD